MKQKIVSQLIGCLEHMKKSSPRIHMIPNEVSASWCADIIAAVGAKPIMALAPEETGTITAHAESLVVNMGQLTLAKQEAIRQSLIAAKVKGIPIVVDPVGIGASEFRMQFGLEILESSWSGILKVNTSEYKALIHRQLTHTGVDGVESMTKERVSIDKERVLCVTGEKDYIIGSDFQLQIGHEKTRLPQIVGSGCAVGALNGVVSVGNHPLYASACASYMMAIAAIQAEIQAKGYRDYQMYLVDALYQMEIRDFEKYSYLIIENE